MNDVQILKADSMRTKIEHWLKLPDPSTNYNKALQQRHEGSGVWFLECDAFMKWKKQRNSFLWLQGMTGCGKTILSSTIIKSLDDTPSFRPLIYFYFDVKDTEKRTLESMVRSLLGQLFSINKQTSVILEKRFTTCDSGKRQPPFESLSQDLLKMIEQVKEVWIILDALDECSTRGGTRNKGLLSWIEALLQSKKANIHLLVTGRPEPDGISKKEFAHYDKILPIKTEAITEDIQGYIRKRVKEDECFQIYQDIPGAVEKIEKRLGEKADGM
jgi:hypothetical protein